MDKKKIILFVVLLVFIIGMSFAVFKSNPNSSKIKLNNQDLINKEDQSLRKHEQERKTYTKELNVYNASEYIDSSTIVDFEKEYKVRVNYYEFESNEDMYDDVVSHPTKYDVLVPSDYMIDRLIKEGRLAKLDKSKVKNISYVASEYLNPVYDTNNDYVVPYMVGTLGILYNTKKVTETVDSWSILFNSKYRNKILMWDSERDCLGAALKMLGYSMNSKNKSEIDAAAAKLSAQRSFAIYGEEDIRDMMIAGEGAVSLMYSGEAKHAVDQNHDLAYIIPREGGNKWVDGFVIVKNAKNMDSAQEFINFMSSPSIAIRNMTATGYTSAIKGAWAEFNGNKIMFPSTEELDRSEAFLYDATATELYDKAWSTIK